MNNKKIKKTIFIIILVIIISLIIFTIYSIANSNKEKNPNSELNQNIINEIENLTQEVNETNNTQINETANEILNNTSNNTVETNVIEDTSQDESNNQPAEENPLDSNANQGSSESNNSDVSVNTGEFDSTVAFIGDSRTQGLIMYNGLKYVQDYSYIGLMVDTAVTKKFVKTDNGNKITLLEDMKNKNIKKVYIMLGVNELGWSYPQVFKVKYGELIDEIRKVKPDCQIYLQSIIPVTKSKSNSDSIYNNTNIAKFNEYIKQVANEKGVHYLNVKSVLVDSEGNLPENASTDGIHVGKTYCQKWLKYLEDNS